MSGLDHAVLGFQQAIDSPRRHRLWRWLVRQRMAGVKDALSGAHSRGSDGWLAARERSLLLERAALLERLIQLGPRILEAPHIDELDAELHRLLADLQRYQQRTNDLVYDAVSLELGGSE